MKADEIVEPRRWKKRVCLGSGSGQLGEPTLGTRHGETLQTSLARFLWQLDQRLIRFNHVRYLLGSETPKNTHSADFCAGWSGC
jgi:hypothetical protein